jgi:hypothetical protein
MRIVFAVGARLHMSAAAVERLSMRELLGWVEFFTPTNTAADDGVPEVANLSRSQLRAMFHHDR